MNAREKLVQFAEINGLKKDQLIGWSIAADFAEWYVEQQASNPSEDDVKALIISDEEMREPIENALYATKRFLTTEATDLAEYILVYIKDAGFTIMQNAPSHSSE